MRSIAALLLLAWQVNAAINADMIMHAEGLARGVAHDATVRNGMDGVTSVGRLAGTNSDFARVYIVAAPVTNTLSITCNGTNYTGGTNWWKFITATNLGDDQMDVYVGTDDANSTVGNIHLFGLARFNVTNNTGNSMNLDPIRVYGGGGSWFVSQIRPRSSGDLNTHTVLAHSPSGFTTTGYFTNNATATVLWEIFRDYTNNMGYARFRDADNGMALIGETSITVPPQGGGYGKTWKLEFPVGYIGDPDGAIYLSDFAGRFNASAAFLTDSELGIATQPIIAESNRWDFAVGWNLGIRGGRVAPTGTIINVTNAPYNADWTGATDAGAAIQSAINAAASNDVVYLPPGFYNCKTNNLTLNRNGVTLDGAGTNTIIFGAITFGHSSSGNYVFAVTNGAHKGSTNLVLPAITNQFGNTIAAGDLFKISALEDDTNGGFPVIATSGGNKRLISQMVQCYSRSGSTVTISSPLIWNFTNQPTLTSKTLTGGGGGLGPAVKMALQDLTITGTNHLNGQVAGKVYNIFVVSTVDTFISNVVSEWCQNYALGVENSLRPQIEHCTFRYAQDPVGTSRSGAIFTTTSEYLLQDNIFHDLGVAWQHFGSVCGNAAFGNFTTNITSNGDFLNHSVHNFFNFFEGNSFNSSFVYDGYFGSSSHAILYRNRIAGTTSFKRNISHMQVVGNVMGSTNYTYRYIAEETPNYSTYGIFELGFPNIGNTSFVGTTPPTSWNFPGTNFVADNNTISTSYPNGVVTFTNTQGPTNILYGNFTNRVAPATIWGSSTPAILFQESGNTNRYYSGTNGDNGLTVLTNFGDSIVVSDYVTVSNGWTLYGITAASSYQQLQASNKYTHTIHGNLVYTNAAGVLVWDSAIANHNLTDSMLYPNGAPGWWTIAGTNAIWPGIDPERATPVAMIPSQARYLGIGEEGGGDVPPATTAQVRVNGPAVLSGKVVVR
jgi:hypothetical protein